jgi:hypothetical protein
MVFVKIIENFFATKITCQSISLYKDKNKLSKKEVMRRRSGCWLLPSASGPGFESSLAPWEMKRRGPYRNFI